MTEASLLSTLTAQEQRLTAAINAGVGLVQGSVDRLDQRLTTSLLDQERRNANFADRDRLSKVEGQVDTLRTAADLRSTRIADLEKGLGDANATSRSELNNRITYIITACAVIAASGAGAILDHLLK